MAGDRAYLDYNASAPLLAEAKAAMLSALDLGGNPSSVHAEGRAARQLIEEARRHVAALVGGEAEHVVFTSGATEAAATLLSPNWRLGRGPLRMGRLYVCETDHPCLLAGGGFAPERISRIGVDANGVIRLDLLHNALGGHDASEGLPLVAVHAANNETGVIQPIAQIAAAAKSVSAVFVVDAVQTAGRADLRIGEGHGDFVIVSAHKIGGPMGVGAIVAASGLMMPAALIGGGGQERGHRGGTENVPGIAGFGVAARVALANRDNGPKLLALRQEIEAAVLRIGPGATIHGAAVDRLINTVCFSVPGTKAETIQIALDLAGVATSAGSACSSGKTGPSHVLKAMGWHRPEGAVRVSIGAGTTSAEIERFAEALETFLSRMGNRAA